MVAITSGSFHSERNLTIKGLCDSSTQLHQMQDIHSDNNQDISLKATNVKLVVPFEVKLGAPQSIDFLL